MTRLLLAAVCFMQAQGQLVADSWKAGVAKVDITPEKFMWMSGYASRNKPAQAKLHSLWAKALVLEDAKKNRALLVTLDLVGISRELASNVCKSAGEKFGFRRDAIALSTSHTHTGPVVGRNLNVMYFLDEKNQKLVDEYATTLEKKIVRVMGEAIRDLKPAKLQWGNGLSTFAVNRRENRGDINKLRREGKLKGPFDHQAPVLAVTDEKGKYRAIVFGYACHATVLSYYKWTGDYPGFAQIAVEKKHPEAIAMFWAGCGGDQNPLPRRTEALAKKYGDMLAKSVEAVLQGKMKPIKGQLRTLYREINLPFAALPTREKLLKDSESKNRYVKARAKYLLKKLATEEKLPKSYPYPIQTWRLGEELSWVILGGEVVVDYALRIKKEVGPKNTWVMAYANDVMAYIPSLRVLREGGYEGGGAMIYYGQPTVWAPKVEELIVDEVHRQIKQLRR